MKRISIWKQCGLIVLMLSCCFCVVANPSAEQWRQYDIRVDGMTCPFCVATSQRALEKIVGVQAVASNLERGEMSVCVDDRVVFTDEQLKKLFASKGFTFRSFTASRSCSIGEQPVTSRSEELDHDHDYKHGKHEAGHGAKRQKDRH